MNQQTTARSRAIATQDAEIASNVAKIEATKQRPSALEAMAGRLNVSPGSLTSTLKNTVFKGASDSEFVALVVVSNAYGLNPLLKEIFAFPAKGGGIIPVVSVDGWIRITNEHPAFDGIEFNDIIDDNGSLYAIESVIYRRDRSRPIKVTEYMDECKGTGPAWQKTPKRMLRHRALIQGARVAFGFSGIYAEDDEPVGYVQQDGGEAARPVAMPTRREMITHDTTTGEIEEDEEEIARRLDAETTARVEGRDDDDDQQEGDSDERHPSAVKADELIGRLDNVEVLGTIISVEGDLKKHAPAMREGDVERVRIAIANARKPFDAAREQGQSEGGK